MVIAGDSGDCNWRWAVGTGACCSWPSQISSLGSVVFGLVVFGLAIGSRRLANPAVARQKPFTGQGLLAALVCALSGRLTAVYQCVPVPVSGILGSLMSALVLL